MTSEYAVLSSCSADKMTFDKDDKYIIEIEMVNMRPRLTSAMRIDEKMRNEVNMWPRLTSAMRIDEKMRNEV